MRTSKITSSLLPPSKLMGSERLELELLRQENDVLKKLKAELSIKNRRDNYEKDAVIRKQKKQIRKLQQEVNALKVIQGRVSSQPVSALPINSNKQKLFWQGDNLFNRTG